MLTVKEIDAAAPDPAKDWRLSDAQNLYLLVRKNGARLWRWDYAFQGRRNTLSFGQYPIVTLGRAREKKREAQVLLDRGIDPGAKRQDEKRAAQAPRDETFAVLAAAWVAQKERAGKKPRTILKLNSILRNYLLPLLGPRPIGTLTAEDVMSALRPIDEKGLAETAHRALSITSEVFTYARAHGKAAHDVTAKLSRGLTPVQTTNYPAITEPAALGRLLRSIAFCNGSPIVCAALRFAPLVFVRAGELRGARWSEFDLADRVWRIPAARMSHTFSNGPHHVIPLARQALAILTELQPLSGGGVYVFPSLRHPSRPLSDMALTAALRRLGYGPDEQSVHGFRTIAGTRLREIGFPDPLVELQLAHRIKNPVEAAYNKATMLERRAEMMQRYADHLDELREKADREDAARRAS
jgi:integrase